MDGQNEYNQILKKCPKHARHAHLTNWACKHGYHDILVTLLTKFGMPKKNKLLITASRWGHIRIVKYLVEWGEDVTAKTYRAIQYAMKYDHEVVANYLCSKLGDERRPLGKWRYHESFNKKFIFFKALIKCDNSKYIKRVFTPQYVKDLCDYHEGLAFWAFQQGNPYVQLTFAKHPGMVKYIKDHGGRLKHLQLYNDIRNIIIFANGFCIYPYLASEILMIKHKKFTHHEILNLTKHLYDFI